MLCSCSNEDSGRGSKTEFVSTIKSGSRWNAGDGIGLFMLGENRALSSGAIENRADNVAYTAASGGASSAFTAVNNDIRMPGGRKVDFIGYYPYAESIEDYKYPVDVSDQSNPAALAFLYSNNAVAQSSKNAPVELEFTHQMSKVVFNVVKGSMVGDITNLSATIEGMPATALFSLAEGVFINESNSTTPINVRKTGELSLEAILIPQRAEAYSQRKVMFNAQPYGVFEWSVDTADEFVGGNTYTYQVNVNYNGVEVTLAEVARWDDTNPTEGLKGYNEGTYAPTPNCYMVAPGGTIVFPVRKAYQAWRENTVLAATSPDMSGAVTCELVWEDVSGLISSVTLDANGDKGSSSMLKVVTNSSKGAGNAVVAVKIGGVVRWSWHIWVIDYNPDRDNYTYNNGLYTYTFMDRNLGATTTTVNDINTFGMYYQWGRKDPFPGPSVSDTGVGLFDIDETNQRQVYGSSITPYTSYEDCNLAYSVTNPTTYILTEIDESIPQTPYYWWYSIKPDLYPYDDYLWTDEKGGKALFDPCPEGWMVPKTDNYEIWDSPWYDIEFGDDNARYDYGWFWSKGGYYPSAGSIKSDNYQWMNIGVRGRIWISYGATEYAESEGILTSWGNFHFFDESGHTLWYSSKSDGHPVRCVKE